MSDDRRTPPPTEEGWFVLHDFRAVDWDGWTGAPERNQQSAIEAGQQFFEDAIGLSDAEAGGTALYSIIGGEADLLVIYLRPSTADLDRLERQYEQTDLARYTDRVTSFFSVTEASGYSERAREYFEGELDDDSGLVRYIESRLYPTIPEVNHVCFYPMDKRRTSEYNWYARPFEERAEHMAAHGEIGRDYGGRVTQMITGAVGLDDYEWGITLWADDLVDIKKLLYDMRFDPSTSRFAEFGSFTVGRRLDPADLEALLFGTHVSTGSESDPTHQPGQASKEMAPAPASGSSSGEPTPGSGAKPASNPNREQSDEQDSTSQPAEQFNLRGELDDLDIYAGQPHGEDVYALVSFSDAKSARLFETVRNLRENFDHYETHVKTAIYEPTNGTGESAVVSIWETQSAAETAAGFLSDLPGHVRRAGKTEGWGTMGMFYEVKDQYRDDFVEKFGEITRLLEDQPGHNSTRLLANHENTSDMFIDSEWEDKTAAMAFFRSEEFAATVEWGRDVLADRPRHVFLA